LPLQQIITQVYTNYKVSVTQVRQLKDQYVTTNSQNGQTSK